jgi:hypothetical protein
MSGLATRSTAVGAFCGAQKLLSFACSDQSSFTTCPRATDLAPCASAERRSAG